MAPCVHASPVHPNPTSLFFVLFLWPVRACTHSPAALFCSVPPAAPSLPDPAPVPFWRPRTAVRGRGLQLISHALPLAGVCSRSSRFDRRASIPHSPPCALLVRRSRRIRSKIPPPLPPPVPFSSNKHLAQFCGRRLFNRRRAAPGHIGPGRLSSASPPPPHPSSAAPPPLPPFPLWPIGPALWPPTHAAGTPFSALFPSSQREEAFVLL